MFPVILFKVANGQLKRFWSLPENSLGSINQCFLMTWLKNLILGSVLSLPSEFPHFTLSPPVVLDVLLCPPPLVSSYFLSIFSLSVCTSPEDGYLVKGSHKLLGARVLVNIRSSGGWCQYETFLGAVCLWQ